MALVYEMDTAMGHMVYDPKTRICRVDNGDSLRYVNMLPGFDPNLARGKAVEMDERSFRELFGRQLLLLV